MPKPRVLILEDMPDRMAVFYKRFEGRRVEIVHVETAADCIRELEAGDFDVVFLDHDLGLKVYVPSEHKNTGAEVARWVSRHPEVFDRVGAFVLHSLNGPGRRYMLDTMNHERVYNVPGVWEKELFEETVKF